MSSSSSSHPSLLQLRRPASLVFSDSVASGSVSAPVTPAAESSSCTAHEDHGHGRSHSPASIASNSNSSYFTCRSAHPTRLRRAHRSMGWECDGTPLVSESDDAASAMLSPSAPYDSSPLSDRLLKVCGTKGEMVPREQWQPDQSSALCTFPMCSNLFAPANSYLVLGARRHHCRMCGLLFCADHSSARATLLARQPDGTTRVKQRQRVCDLCDPSRSSRSTRATDEDLAVEESDQTLHVSARHDALEDRRGSASSSSSQPSLRIVTPSGDDSASIDVAFGYKRATPVRKTSQAPTPLSLSPVDPAPLQTWMGKDGVLSLYPLAAQPSHSRDTCPAPIAAKPLFQPSLAMRRDAKERERLRLCMRSKKNAEDKEKWLGVPGGLRTPVIENDSDGEEVL